MSATFWIGSLVIAWISTLDKERANLFVCVLLPNCSSNVGGFGSLAVIALQLLNLRSECNNNNLQA